MGKLKAICVGVGFGSGTETKGIFDVMVLKPSRTWKRTVCVTNFHPEIHNFKTLLKTTNHLHSSMFCSLPATLCWWVHVFAQDETVGTRKAFSLSYLPTNDESLIITFNLHPMVETKKGKLLLVSGGGLTHLFLLASVSHKNVNFPSHHHFNSPTQGGTYVNILCCKLLNMFTLQ